MPLVTTNEALVYIIMYNSDVDKKIHQKASKCAHEYSKLMKKFIDFFIKSIETGKSCKKSKDVFNDFFQNNEYEDFNFLENYTYFLMIFKKFNKHFSTKYSKKMYKLIFKMSEIEKISYFELINGYIIWEKFAIN
jgi:hypothetical protein